MLHPIGSRRPAVYWRRRVALLGALVVLTGLTVWVLRPGGDKGDPKPGAAGTQAHKSTASASAPSTSRALSPTVKPTGTSRSTGTAACQPAALKVAAVVERPSYRVGDQPMVLLQVTNSGPAPCVQDLADSQVELRVYNGESRVWGSHDCTIEPGSAARILTVGQPVRVSVVWSGLSSQPKCAGARQRVGAGTYTLYALLGGRQGAATQFSVS